MISLTHTLFLKDHLNYMRLLSSFFKGFYKKYRCIINIITIRYRKNREDQKFYLYYLLIYKTPKKLFGRKKNFLKQSSYYLRLCDARFKLKYKVSETKIGDFGKTKKPYESKLEKTGI